MSIDLQSERSALGRRDRVIRRRLPLWEPEPPKLPVLMDLYRYWESLRPTGMIPSRKDFDILRLKAVMGTTSVVDVDDHDPHNFRLRLYPTNLHLPGTMANRTLAEMEYSEMYREALMQDYAAARDVGAPLYHEIVAMLDYVTHSYARLILPFAADGRTVNQLVVSSVRQDFPNLVQLLH